jgi:orotate phosphoribosyltransferase
MTDEQYLALFKEKGALLEGHFVLSSGLHSNRYLQSALLLQYPEIAEKLGKAIAEKFPMAIDAVVNPAMGGLIIGHEVARAKKTRAVFSEKDNEGKPVFRRGFSLLKGEKILVIEDVITTGLSTSEVIGLVEKAGALLVGVGSIVNRAGKGNEKLLRWRVPVHSLLTLEVQSWETSVCPLCKEGIPAIKPGSRKI